jgi:hypothetical protein
MRVHPAICSVIAVLGCTAALPAMDLATTAWDVRVNAGITTPVTKLDVKGITVGSTTENQQLDTAKKIGPHLGVQLQRSRVGSDGVGWTIALEGAWDHHVGQVESINNSSQFSDGAKVALDTFTGNLFVGLVLQADLRDMGVRADTFRVEIGPTIGGGVAQATVDGVSSGSGPVGSAGAQIGFVSVTEGGVVIALVGGFEYSVAQVKWDNTDASTVTALGPIARLGIGYRW